ncbi:MAG TPA: hypothetical protein VH518_21640 [Tepidisphaeraceae bacterium]|jgi:hypothetical protein
MRELLFDTPWWLPTTLIGIGLVVFISGNRRQEKQVTRFGLAMLLLGILVAGVSYLVDTDIEKAERRTRELVASASRHDWPAFKSLLDQQTTIYSLHGPDAITNAVKAGSDRLQLANLHITGLEVEQTQTVIKVTVRVYSESSYGSGLTDWQLQYQNFGQGWVLRTVTALSNPQVSEDRIRAEIPRLGG